MNADSPNLENANVLIKLEQCTVILAVRHEPITMGQIIKQTFTTEPKIINIYKLWYCLLLKLQTQLRVF